MSRKMCERKVRKSGLGAAALLAVVASASAVQAQPQWLRDDRVMQQGPQGRGQQARPAAPAPRPAVTPGRTVDIARSGPSAPAPRVVQPAPSPVIRQAAPGPSAPRATPIGRTVDVASAMSRPATPVMGGRGVVAPAASVPGPAKPQGNWGRTVDATLAKPAVVAATKPATTTAVISAPSASSGRDSGGRGSAGSGGSVPGRTVDVAPGMSRNGGTSSSGWSRGGGSEVITKAPDSSRTSAVRSAPVVADRVAFNSAPPGRGGWDRGRSGHDGDHGRDWDRGRDGNRGHDWNRGRDWDDRGWGRRGHSSVFLDVGLGVSWGSVSFSTFGGSYHRSPYWWGWRDPWCSPWYGYRRSYYVAPVVYTSPVFCSTVVDPWCSPCVDPVFSRCEIIHVPVYEPSAVWTYSNPTYASVASTPGVVLASPVVAASTLPAPATAQELRTSSDRELGDTYLRLGDPDNAVRVYEQHVAKHPGDSQGTRALGVAQIAAGRLTEGVEQIERAYRVDPSLADRPLTPQDVFAGPEDFQRVLDLTTRTANGSNSGPAWLAAAVMLQADGRPVPARSALEKAKAAGLDPAVYDWFKGVLPSGEQAAPAVAPTRTP